VLLFGLLCCSAIATASCARTQPAGGRPRDLPSSTARVAPKSRTSPRMPLRCRGPISAQVFPLRLRSRRPPTAGQPRWRGWRRSRAAEPIARVAGSRTVSDATRSRGRASAATAARNRMGDQGLDRVRWVS
jgi:hypothetical protein